MYSPLLYRYTKKIVAPLSSVYNSEMQVRENLDKLAEFLSSISEKTKKE